MSAPVSDSGDDDCIVKLRGLPWSATVDDVIDFFSGCEIARGKDGVHMTTSRDGRPSGEAFVEFENMQDVEKALDKDRENIGSRYIEVFKVDRTEMEWVLKRSGSGSGEDDGCIRLRGLPFGCSKEEIAHSFAGLEIVPNGIILLTDSTGRSTGQAYVEFINRDVAEKALHKHREKIGPRYIEIYRSNLTEVQSTIGYHGNKRFGGMAGGMFGSRPGPYDRDNRRGTRPFRGSRSITGSNYANTRDLYKRPMMPHVRGGDNRMGARFFRGSPGFNYANNRGFNERPIMTYAHGGNMGPPRKGNYGEDQWMSEPKHGGAHMIRMRGLPFKAKEDDIAEFFKPIIPIDIHLIVDNSGRASGEADVEFASHDEAVCAMGKDKSNMQHRYIELFLNSRYGVVEGRRA